MDKKKTAEILRKCARTVLLALGVPVFLFALVSGAGDYGGGLRGIIMNSPNALPWLILVVFVLVAFKWEMAGGMLVIAVGLFSAVFFDFLKPGGYFGLFVITVPLVVMGSAFIAARLLSQTPSLQERMERQRQKMSRKAKHKDAPEK